MVYLKRQLAGLGQVSAADLIGLARDYQKKILTIAHTIPIAGHLGKNKTTKQIMQLANDPL